MSLDTSLYLKVSQVVRNIFKCWFESPIIDPENWRFSCIILDNFSFDFEVIIINRWVINATSNNILVGHRVVVQGTILCSMGRYDGCWMSTCRSSIGCSLCRGGWWYVSVLNQMVRHRYLFESYNAFFK